MKSLPFEVGGSKVGSDAAYFEPERAGGECQIAIVGCQHEPLTRPILPHQSGRHVQRIESSEGGRKRFSWFEALDQPVYD